MMALANLFATHNRPPTPKPLLPVLLRCVHPSLTLPVRGRVVLQCFSSVVGPNGSGKSNVIDAMLFVFGFRASKIRQGKLSGLIHNSASHTNLDECSVAVHFQMIRDSGAAEDAFDVIPGSEVIVKRFVRKDNTSGYSYNGKKMGFKELAVELRRLGIDLDHNRFLILQVR